IECLRDVRFAAHKHVDFVLPRRDYTHFLDPVPRAPAQSGRQADRGAAAGELLPLRGGKCCITDCTVPVWKRNACCIVEPSTDVRAGAPCEEGISIRAQIAGADPLAAWSVTGVHCLLAGGFDVEKNVVSVGSQAAPSRGDAEARCLAISILTDGVAKLTRKSLEAPAQDDVDHAGDCVRPVDCRTAVLEYLDAVHDIEWQRAEVHEGTLTVISQSVCGRSPAVDQHESCVDRQTP